MNDRTEQYLWINFGLKNTAECHRENKASGNVLAGIGYAVKGAIITNHFFSAENLEYPWLEPRYSFDPLTTHHIVFTVGSGYYSLSIDGEQQFNGSLPAGYSGGYVGIGTGQTGTEISNLTISGEPFLYDECYLKPSAYDFVGYKMPPEAFYSNNNGKLIRIFNGSGSFTNDVPMLYSNKTYENFTIEFDLFFSNSYMKDPPPPKKVVDPFNTYAFGPPPLGLFTDTHSYGDIQETVLHDDCFEIKFKVPPCVRQGRSLFISCPNVGGVRITSVPPKTAAEAPACDNAIFEPEYSLPINKNGFENTLVGTDGTRVSLVTEGSYWGIKIYNAQGTLLNTINRWNINYTDDRFLTRQYILSLPLKPGEVIFGTGERYNHFNQNGQRVCFWNTDPCYHGNSSLENYELWRGYKNVPIVSSDRGITYFFNTTCYGTGDFGFTDKTRMELRFDDYRVDFYIWTGTPLENIIKYTDLTGKQVLPPKWAFRYMAGGSNGCWGLNRNTKAQKRQLLRPMIDGYKSLGTMPAGMYFEGGGTDDIECYKICAENGMKVLQWNCGDYFPAKMHEWYPDKSYNELPMAQSLTNPDEVHYFGDFTHPDSHEVIKKIHGENISLGLRGGMVDFTELVPYDTKFYNGLCGNRMHNFWVYWYAKAYHDLYEDLVGDDYLCYMRGACAGSQKWNCTWTGDQTNGFEGMRQQVVAGLSLSSCGFSVWGTDMCGLTGVPTSEQLIRAFEFNTFIPIMRTGGDCSKLPWDYGVEAEKAFQKYYWTRENILDTVYSYAAKSHITGIPMTQALALAYPEEKDVSGNEEEYIFCENMLVAPVLEEGAESKKVYFPKGTWYSLFNGDVISGGSEKTVSATLDTIPVYLREGTVTPIVFDSSMSISAPMTDERFTALLITPPDARRTLSAYVSKDEKSDFVNEKNSNSTFTVTVYDDRYSDAVVYAAARSVFVNGEKISGFESIDKIPTLGGFTVRDGKTYIRMGNKAIRSLQIVTE